MTTLTDNTALIIVDVQDGLDDPIHGERNNPDAEQNMARLLADWREKQRPIFYVQHMSVQPHSTLRPELPGNKIKDIIAPQGDEPIIQKTASNGFVGTDLEQRLRDQNIESVVVVGLTTEHCVSTTVRIASDLGFETMIVADATACHEHHFRGKHYPAEVIHQSALVALQGEFATVVDTDDLLTGS